MESIRIFSALFVLLLNASLVIADTTPVRIGVIIPLTGSFAELGEDCQRGIAVSQNSLTPEERPAVTLVTADSRADPKTAITEFQRLIETEKIQSALTVRSTVSLALNPISLKRKIPLAAAAGVSAFPQQNSYAFQFWTVTTAEGQAIAKFLAARGVKRVALVTLEDDWTLDVTDAFRNSVQDRDMKIVFDERVLADEMDFSSIVTRLRSANADQVFINVGLQQSGALIRRLREQGFTQPIFSNFWSGKPEALAIGGKKAMEGVNFVEFSLDLPKLREVLKAQYGDDRASAITLICAAASQLLMKTAAHLEDHAPEALYRSMLAMTEVALPDGPLRVEDRRAKFQLAVKEIRAGKVIELQKID